MLNSHDLAGRNKLLCTRNFSLINTLLNFPPAHLSQGLSIRAHVCKNNQHMVFTLISKEFCCGQRQTWSNDTFNTIEKGTIINSGIVKFLSFGSSSLMVQLYKKRKKNSMRDAIESHPTFTKLLVY